MATTTHPALKAQARYTAACDRFDHALDGYLYVRETHARDSAPAQGALKVLQGAKALRLATWAQWMAHSTVQTYWSETLGRMVTIPD